MVILVFTRGGVVIGDVPIETLLRTWTSSSVKKSSMLQDLNYHVNQVVPEKNCFISKPALYGPCNCKQIILLQLAFTK